MNMNFISKGMGTSEFKLTFLNLLGSFALLGYLVYSTQWEQYQMLVAVLLANVTLSTAWYGQGRVNLKRSEIVANSPLAETITAQVKAADEAVVNAQG